jgi:hypothetical protein
MKQRNIATCIILYFVTCGFYSWYWLIQLTDDSNEVSGMPTASGGVALLLYIFTCRIYAWYWNYKLGEKLDSAVGDGGNRAVLYLILSIFGLDVINMALAQNELNQLQQQY